MSAKEIFGYYKQYDQDLVTSQKHKWKALSQPKTDKERLKIGYVSPDLSQHSMQNFLMPTLTASQPQQIPKFLL